MFLKIRTDKREYIVSLSEQDVKELMKLGRAEKPLTKEFLFAYGLLEFDNITSFAISTDMNFDD